MVSLSASCSSTPTTPYRPLSEVRNTKVPNIEVIGTISAIFVGGPNIKGETVYTKLLSAANEQYSGNIDVADIQWSIVNTIDLDLIFVKSVFEYTASGKVISLGERL